MKQIVYIDMDNVIVDFKSGIAQLDEKTLEAYESNYDEVPGIFGLMQPMPGAINAVNILVEYYDVYILSTAPWLNPDAWTDKVKWIQKHFGKDKDSVLYKCLIISHHKNLNRGNFLIDDRTKNGASEFEGTHIHFGQDHFPDWNSVLNYFLQTLIYS